jgi:RecA-family ATPase
LVEQLGCAGVLRRDWFGIVPEPDPVLGIFREDDEDEIHNRLAAIAEHYNATFTDLRDFMQISLVGKDATLAATDRFGRTTQPTGLYDRLTRLTRDLRPRLVIIDNSADVYAGNENDRSQVHQFIGLMRRRAVDLDTTVIQSSDPSLTGMSGGTGTSGSTAWNASVRSRLYLHCPRSEASEEGDPDERVLEVMKSNYGPAGEVIRMRWQRGLARLSCRAWNA